MNKLKNIPTYYTSKGTPIYRDTTALPFADGGPLHDRDINGKLLQSTYATPLGNMFREGGPFGEDNGVFDYATSIYASQPGNYYAPGGMIKRADGSYSARGLWDNIRANKGSGKEPTKEMLSQERKINRKYRTGGQFPRPYSLPEDSFKQGGKNLHNSVYASSGAPYPGIYKYGGSFEMPRQQMYMPLDNVEKYGGYLLKNGGSILSMSNTPQLEGEGKDLTYPDGAYAYRRGGVIRTSHLFADGGPIDPINARLAQFLNPEFQKIVQGQEVTVKPNAYQIQKAKEKTLGANRYNPLEQKSIPSETTQKAAKQYMQAEDLNQVAANIERSNMIKNMEDPGHLYKTMTDEQIMNVVPANVKDRAKQLLDQGVFPNMTDAVRDQLIAAEEQKIDRIKNPLVKNSITGQMVDPRQAGSWNNYNDAPAQSVDWVWTLPLAAPAALEGLGALAATEIPGLGGLTLGTAADIYGGVEGTKSLVDAYGAHRKGNTKERNEALLNAGLNLALPGALHAAPSVSRGLPTFTKLESLPKIDFPEIQIPKTGFSELEKEIGKQADEYVKLATSEKNYERARALDKEYGTEYVKALDNLERHKDYTNAINKLPLNIKTIPNDKSGAAGWSGLTEEGRIKAILNEEGLAPKPTINDREIAVMNDIPASDAKRVTRHEIKHHYTLGQDIDFYKNKFGDELSDMLATPGEISRTNPDLANALIQPAFKRENARSLFEYLEDPREIDAYINTNLRDELVDQGILKNHWDELTDNKVAKYLMNNPHKISKKYLDLVKDPEFIKMFNKGVYSIAPLATGAALTNPWQNNNTKGKELKMGGPLRIIKSSQLMR